MTTSNETRLGLIAAAAAVALALIATVAVDAAPVPRPASRGHHAARIDVRLLPGTWRYVAAYVRFDDGTIGYNFTPEPVGLFIIGRDGHYSHIVMSPDLPSIASGQLKVQTEAEARAISTNLLAHFGTWEASPANSTFTVRITKSSFPNFDGISQVRTVTKLTRDSLEYINHTVTNGQGAVVVARLSRVLPH